MSRLVYRKTARRDLAEIAAFVERESQDRGVARAFVDKLTRYREHLAQLPGLMGRPRPELGPDYRSTTFGSYVIFCGMPTKSPRAAICISCIFCAVHATWTLISVSVRMQKDHSG